MLPTSEILGSLRPNCSKGYYRGSRYEQIGSVHERRRARFTVRPVGSQIGMEA